MSAAVSRKGDLCTGHGPYPPRPSTSGSSNVRVNGIECLRKGDSYAVHAKPPKNPNPHGSVLSDGSSSVMVNGRPMGRIGDPVACGSASAVGSRNVFAG